MSAALETESVDWHSVVILGELTTASGPYFDDHFLIAVFSSGEIIQYSTNKVLDVIPAIERITGAKIEFRLCNITDMASRIIFPPPLFDHPLFEFYQKQKGFLGFLKNIQRGGMTEVSMRFTKEVKEYIEKQK